VLLPAVMALLGERNWYLPKWLHRLPDLTHDESPEPVAAAAPLHGEGERLSV
jgi:RND superfamily putative drug exporter